LYSFRIESNTEVTIRFEISNIRTVLLRAKMSIGDLGPKCPDT